MNPVLAVGRAFPFKTQESLLMALFLLPSLTAIKDKGIPKIYFSWSRFFYMSNTLGGGKLNFVWSGLFAFCLDSHVGFCFSFLLSTL